MKSIFVSSTFKDMQSERNLIQFKVTPEINRFLKEYDETVEFTDLRWGIDTTKYINSTPEKQIEGEEKVLKICLEEISKTPYFIVVLGERYGWIPENKKMVKHVIEIINKEKQTNYTITNNDMSVTHLEIDYGAFFREHPENCLFYFREIKRKEEKRGFFGFKGKTNKKESIYFSNSEELEKINLLKEEIRKKFPGRVKTYSVDFDEKTNEISGLDNFANMIIQDVKDIIKRDFKKIETDCWQEREEKEINYIMKQKTVNFTGQELILEKINNFIENDTNKDILFITGKAGTGKSAVSSKIYQIYENKYDVVPFFMDNTEHSGNKKDILLYQIYQLHKRMFAKYEALQKSPKEPNMLIEYVYSEEKQEFIGVKKVKYNKDISDMPIEILRENLEKNLEVYEKVSDKKIIFVIDALDQMQKEDDKEYNWLIQNSKNKIKYIITCLDDSSYAEKILERMEHIELKELDKKEVTDILVYYNKFSTKELNEEVIKKICEKKESTNFLYLSLVLQRFKMFCKYDYEMIKKFGNDMNAINKHMLSIVEFLPDELSNLCAQIMEYANEIYPESMFKDILGLIANTRFGLREKDIEGIFKQNGIDFDTGTFKILLNLLNNYFIIRDDERVDFSHRIIKQTIKQQYEKERFANTDFTYNDIITAYLTNLIFIDSEEVDMIYLNDFVFHLWKARKYIPMLMILIEKLMLEENKINAVVLAKELWKYFRVTPEWLWEMQDEIASNVHVDILRVGEKEYSLTEYDLGECLEFFFVYLKNVMNNNAYEKRIFLDLAKWWEYRISEGNVNKYILTETVLETCWEIISEYSRETLIITEALKKLIDYDKKNYSYYIKLIDATKKENNIYWLKKRAEYIEEALQNENVKNDINIYEEVLLNKAEVSVLTNDNDTYNEIMNQMVEKHKTKINEPNVTLEDFEEYLQILKNKYTKFDTEPLQESNQKVKEIIKSSLDALKWAKSQYRNNPSKETKIQLAQAYELVARQYNMLVYKEKWTELSPYNTEKAGKYIICVVEILKDESEYSDYLVKLLDYQIEMVELKYSESKEDKVENSNQIKEDLCKNNDTN